MINLKYSFNADTRRLSRQAKNWRRDPAPMTKTIVRDTQIHAD